MRGLIIFCIASLTAAVPQGYTNSLDRELTRQEQQYSLDGPLVEETLSALSFPLDEVRRPFATYGMHPKYQQNDVLISKKFFIHSAPEEEDDEVAEKVVTVGQNKKNYNIVFIRTPTKVQRPVAVRIIPAIKEEKTVVYVLSKKEGPVDVHATVEETQSTTTKPEVYFIKYKTPEEADHAQGKIQEEYERLGGSTQVVNEGVSPVSSVIGSLHDNATQQDTYSTSGSENFIGGPLDNNGYLPPNNY